MSEIRVNTLKDRTGKEVTTTKAFCNLDGCVWRRHERVERQRGGEVGRRGQRRGGRDVGGGWQHG